MSQLTIERINGRCLTPRDHPAPEAVRARLDAGLAPPRLGPALAARLARLLPESDELWFIRRLALEAVVDVGRAGDAELAALLAARLARATANVVTRPPDGRNVVRFAHRAAYIAHYAGERAAGRDGDRWYFGDFDGLRSLTTSQAIREAIIREPEQAERVLLELAATGHLVAVLATLTPGDMDRIYDACKTAAGGGSARPDRELAGELLAVWRRVPWRPDAGFAATENRLRLWLAWRATAGGPAAPPPSALTPTIDLLVRLRDGLERAPELWRALLAGTLSPGEAVRLAASTHVDTTLVTAVHALMTGDTAWGRQLLQTLQPTTVREEGPATTPRPFTTSCAALFLLLPTMLDTGLARLIAAEAPDEATAALWRYLVLAKCMGGSRFPALRGDRGLLLAAGVDGEPDDDTLTKAANVTSDRLQALRDGWWGALYDQGRADGRSLVVEPLPAAAHRLVIRDALYDYWLAVVEKAQLAAIPDQIAAVFEVPSPVVWQDAPPEDNAATALFRRKAQPAAEAWRHLALTSLPPDIDALLSLLTQGLLRAFARRLMGFAWSSPDYLYRNFLAGDSEITMTAGRLLVTLPAVPLLTVIRLAGIHHDAFTLPWHESRPVTIQVSR